MYAPVGGVPLAITLVLLCDNLLVEVKDPLGKLVLSLLELNFGAKVLSREFVEVNETVAVFVALVEKLIHDLDTMLFIDIALSQEVEHFVA